MRIVVFCTYLYSRKTISTFKENLCDAISIARNLENVKRLNTTQIYIGKSFSFWINLLYIRNNPIWNINQTQICNTVKIFVLTLSKIFFNSNEKNNFSNIMYLYRLIYSTEKYELDVLWFFFKQYSHMQKWM